MTSIDFPNGLTTISTLTFANCSSLQYITIPNNVTEIDSFAFYGCSSMKSVIIPDNVTKIGQKAFEDTGLTVVIMNPVVKNELELEFGSNQSFYGKDNVVIG